MRFCCDGSIVSAHFYRDAMAVMAARHAHNNSQAVLFVFASDDPDWVRGHFGHRDDVALASDLVSESGGVVMDMALLAACNHSIFR